MSGFSSSRKRVVAVAPCFRWFMHDLRAQSLIVYGRHGMFLSVPYSDRPVRQIRKNRVSR